MKLTTKLVVLVLAALFAAATASAGNEPCWQEVYRFPDQPTETLPVEYWRYLRKTTNISRFDGGQKPFVIERDECNETSGRPRNGLLKNLALGGGGAAAIASCPFTMGACAGVVGLVGVLMNRTPKTDILHRVREIQAQPEASPSVPVQYAQAQVQPSHQAPPAQVAEARNSARDSRADALLRQRIHASYQPLSRRSR